MGSIGSDDDGVLMVYDAEPSCKNVVNKAEGTLEGGKITLENNEGVSMSTTTEVTRQSPPTYSHSCLCSLLTLRPIIFRDWYQDQCLLQIPRNR